jgi:hypothetical protein
MLMGSVVGIWSSQWMDWIQWITLLFDPALMIVSMETLFSVV